MALGECELRDPQVICTAICPEQPQRRRGESKLLVSARRLAGGAEQSRVVHEVPGRRITRRELRVVGKRGSGMPAGCGDPGPAGEQGEIGRAGGLTRRVFGLGIVEPSSAPSELTELVAAEPDVRPGYRLAQRTPPHGPRRAPAPPPVAV